jgi:hypothetical protein
MTKQQLYTIIEKLLPLATEACEMRENIDRFQVLPGSTSREGDRATIQEAKEAIKEIDYKKRYLVLLSLSAELVEGSSSIHFAWDRGPQIYRYWSNGRWLGTNVKESIEDIVEERLKNV